MADNEKTVADWNAKCEKAERALDKAIERLNKTALDDDATLESLTTLSKAVGSAKGQVQDLYINLPFSEGDATAAAVVTLLKSQHITPEQMAEIVNRHLSNRHILVILDYVHTLNRHEWEIQAPVGYDFPDERLVSHMAILGRIWVEPKTKKGKVDGWTIGYGLAKGETRLLNKHRLAAEFRMVIRAVEKEFGGLEDESNPAPT